MKTQNDTGRCRWDSCQAPVDGFKHYCPDHTQERKRQLDRQYYKRHRPAQIEKGITYYSRNKPKVLEQAKKRYKKQKAEGTTYYCRHKARHRKANEKAKKARLRSIRHQPCWVCKWDESVCDLHRIFPGRLGGRYQKPNILVICPNCHRTFHRHPYRFLKKLEKAKADPTTGISRHLRLVARRLEQWQADLSL